jgi:hypothetical protein
VVGSSAVVVSPAGAEVDGTLDVGVVVGDVVTFELPPHAARNNAALHPSTAAIRIRPSWHPGPGSLRHRYDSSDLRSGISLHREEGPWPT